MDHRSARPAVVSAAVVIWWLVCASQFATGTARMAGPHVGVGSLVVGAVVFIAWTALIAWVASRMGRGSGRARFWLAVLAVLCVVGAAVGAFTRPVSVEYLEPLGMGVAAALSYLPSARAFFPATARRAQRPPEPAIVGWNPETGEPIRASD